MASFDRLGCFSDVSAEVLELESKYKIAGFIVVGSDQN